MAEEKIVVNTGIKDHAFSILENFSTMRKDGIMCDFVIRVGKETLNVHRDVLAASSKYFRAMFLHDTLEKKNGFVEMKQVAFSAVSKCVDYIYTGDLETSIAELDDLLFVVNTMQLHAVETKLSFLLQSYVTPQSFLKIRHVAFKYGLEDLNAKCDNFALMNLDFLVESGCLSHIEFDYMSFLLSSPLLSANGYSEDAKLATAIRWIKADIEKRQDMLMPLAKLLKMEKVSHSCGKYFVDNEEMCESSTDFLRLMYLSVLNTKGEPVEPSFRRNSEPVAVLTLSNAFCNFQLHDLSTSTWSSKKFKVGKPLLSISAPFKAVCDAEHLYVLSHKRTVFTFDLISNVWRVKTKMKKSHGKYLRATLRNGVIYVSGNDGMERYDITMNSWKVLNSGDICLEQCELITYQGHIMTIGGCRNYAAISDVNMLNTSTFSWSAFPSLNSARQTPAAASLNGNVYVVGGSHAWVALQGAEYYNNATSSWISIPPTIHIHDKFKLLEIQNTLYTVGGLIGYENAELYDISTNQWTENKLFEKDSAGWEAVALNRMQLSLLTKD